MRMCATAAWCASCTAPGDRGTEVHVDLRYDPPGGALGALFAKLFGEEPGRQIADDLRRFKQVMETGEVMLSDATVTDGPHPAQPSGTGPGANRLSRAVSTESRPGDERGCREQSSGPRTSVTSPPYREATT